jgi:hypothetical protein
MAGRSGKKSQAQQPTKSFDEFADDAEGFEEDVPGVDAKAPQSASARTRDWRDVEKYREQRELKRLIGDDLDDLDSAGAAGHR